MHPIPWFVLEPLWILLEPLWVLLEPLWVGLQADAFPANGHEPRRA